MIQRLEIILKMVYVVSRRRIYLSVQNVKIDIETKKTR